MAKTKIIAVANQKGGVGKTTSAFNLAAALTQCFERKVLLVDLDPQGNLSEYLGFEEDDNPTIAQLIMEVVSRSCVLQTEVASAIRQNKENNIDYIPADLSLANAEAQMSTALSRGTVLKRILTEAVVEDYDYVIIDCLPSLGLLLINSLTAANGMLVPVQTQKFSLDGLSALLNLQSQIKNTINNELELVGILPTMVDRTLVSKRSLRTLCEQFGDKVLPPISRSTEAAKSSESGLALCKSMSKLGEQYVSAAERLEAD
ncbi:MAG: AAA family ATPase [Ruminococcus sp.]|nr:AAA family ATPase [Ruminococcus sp.]